MKHCLPVRQFDITLKAEILVIDFMKSMKPLFTLRIKLLKVIAKSRLMLLLKNIFLVISIQIRWRQHMNSFKQKLQKLRDIWEQMVLMLVNQKEKMRNSILNQNEKEEFYLLQFLDQIEELVFVLILIYSFSKKKTDILTNYLKNRFNEFYLSMRKYLDYVKFQKKSKVKIYIRFH